MFLHTFYTDTLKLSSRYIITKCCNEIEDLIMLMLYYRFQVNLNVSVFLNKKICLNDCCFVFSKKEKI